MVSATITSKGQVTIPKDIREYLKLGVGSKIEFVVDENGEVKLIPLNISVEALAGILHQSGGKAATLEEMEAAILEGASDWT